ncbi:lipoate--protein ligase family protein [Mycobacterium sp. M1]|uniref:Lipoate--protein ligase family protein n=1 Tax=Mycolicibacter acidiphilus TaxID=2835306 RepID=A0ABS5RE96_9MYCO|nr:biotin/lipoate A/B protein ligase family protein [Mycolicibacter acidiphilus]MBS9532514.1 lipoate--protein ligase family protein [Mycolicibacter acidiphilus]
MHGEYKVPGGKLVTVDVDIEGERLTNVRVAGDFFLDPDSALDRITGALEGLPAIASAQEIAQAVADALHPGDTLLGFDGDAVGVAVRRALGHALDWDDLDFEVIHSPTVAPMLNVALDETMAEDVAARRRKPFLRIWEWDSPCIVIGSFQSYDNEINQAGIDRHGMTVCRRPSGGGAMFMEPGNCITYSLVAPTALVDGMSFAASYPFLDQWVLEALGKVGVDAHYVPLNDIASDAGKIGGSAQKRFASGVMVHHATMAYDIDADKMLDCLRIGQEKIRDKGIRSAAKRVDPMRSQTGMARADIIAVFLDHFTARYAATPGEVTEADLARAQERCAQKFSHDEWTRRIP